MAQGTPERARQEKTYLKSDLEFFGVTVPAVSKAVREWLLAHPDLTHAEMLALVEHLWAQRVHEIRSFAVALLELRVNSLEPSDLPLVERMLRQARTWAHVDEIAANVVGPLVERYSLLGAMLDRWAVDDDFWIQIGRAHV